MHRRHLGFAAAGIVLLVLAIAIAYQRVQEPVIVPAPDSATTSTPEAQNALPGDGAAPAAQPQDSRLAATPQQTAPAPSVIGTSPLTILEPESTATFIADGTRYPLTAPAGSTLKEAMDRLATESGFTYEYRAHAGLGAFVTKVNGRASDGDHYWILYVNGKQSASGISAMRIRSGDLIEWRLDKSY